MNTATLFNCINSLPTYPRAILGICLYALLGIFYLALGVVLVVCMHKIGDLIEEDRIFEDSDND